MITHCSSKPGTVEFISYNGKWPNLCSGTLKFKVNDKEYELDNILTSGGTVWLSSDYTSSNVSCGEWSIDARNFPEELQSYLADIDSMINSSIPHGCCGGCI